MMNTINDFINEWDFTESQSHWNNKNNHNYFVEVYNSEVVDKTDEELEALFTGYALDSMNRPVEQYVGTYASNWVDAWYVAGVLHKNGVSFDGLTEKRFKYAMFYLDIVLNYELFLCVMQSVATTK